MSRGRRTHGGRRLHAGSARRGYGSTRTETWNQTRDQAEEAQ